MHPGFGIAIIGLICVLATISWLRSQQAFSVSSTKIVWGLVIALALLAVIAFVLHRYGAGFNRNAALAFDIHIVQELLLKLPFRNHAGAQQHAIGKSTLTVIDVRNDGKIANT